MNLLALLVPCQIPKALVEQLYLQNPGAKTAQSAVTSPQLSRDPGRSARIFASPSSAIINRRTRPTEQSSQSVSTRLRAESRHHHRQIRRCQQDANGDKKH